MEYLVDIHSHCLPDVDDGAEGREVSMQMLKTAYEDGIRAIICTPHFHPRRGNTDKAIICSRLSEMQEAVKELYPDLKLYIGNELFYDSRLPELLEEEKVCRMAGSSYVLVEFSFHCEADEVRSGLAKLQNQGFFPILAHVERYSCFVEMPKAAMELAAMGVYLQVNADGVLGNYGSAEKKFIKKLFKEGCVSFVATDAHDNEDRKPKLSECVKYVTKKFGERTAEDCFFNNPMAVINNEII